MAFPAGWAKKHKLTIDNTKVSGTSNLTDFPVYLNEDNFLADVFSNTQGKEINSNYLLNDANLQGYWRMESDWTDTSSNGYDLTPANSPTNNTTGKFGNGGDFEASSFQYASIADASCANLEITGSRTYSAWIKQESAPAANQRFMGKSPDDAAAYTSLGINSSQQPTFTIIGLTTNTSVSSSATVIIGQWHHICGVYDSAGTALKVFIDGVKTEVTASGSSTDTNGDFGLGRMGAWASDYFDGMVDDATVWDRALSDEEVLAIYTGGADLRFSSDFSGSTQIPHEVVNWDIDNSAAEVHVKVPTVSYNSDTTFYVWYDNASATPLARNDTYGSDNVWDSNYKGVYHLNNNYGDSITSGDDLTPVNTPSFATGKVGSGVDLESTSTQYAYAPDSATKSITGDITMTAWINMETLASTLGTDIVFVGKYYTSTGARSYRFGIDGTNDYPEFMVSDDGSSSDTHFQVWEGQTALSASSWYFLTVTFDISAESALFRVNGSAATPNKTTGTTLGASIDDNAARFAIGAVNTEGTPVGLFDGIVDEIRVHDTIRSTDWLDTTYNNQNSPSTFATGSLARTAKHGFVTMGSSPSVV